MTAKPTLKEAIDFLTEKVNNPTCPRCLQNIWSILGTDAEPDAIWISNSASNGIGIPPPTIPVIIVGCSNCGHIELHARAAFDAWKASKATGGANG